MKLATAILKSMLTCPQCGHATEEEMPVDSRRFFHECIQCHTLMRPRAGDCCVFCSYGSIKCPPVQLQGRQCRK
jgi:hypothetical protein